MIPDCFRRGGVSEPEGGSFRASNKLMTNILNHLGGVVRTARLRLCAHGMGDSVTAS